MGWQRNRVRGLGVCVMLALLGISAPASGTSGPEATSQPADKARLIVDDFKAIKSGAISGVERDKKVEEIYDNLHDALPEMNDPFALADDASVLIQFAVNRDVNRLEYFGSDPVVETRLLVPTYLTRLMLWKSHTDSAAKAAAIKARINPANAGTWDRLDMQANLSLYDYHMTSYARALCLPPETRASVIDPSLVFLKDFDNKDSTVMPAVHLMMGKLYLAEGEDDTAVGFFDAIASKRADIDPPPDAGLMFEGRYFAAVAQLDARAFDEAQRELDALITWSTGKMKWDAHTRQATSAGMKLLQYRIDLARGDRTGDPARQTWRAAAEKVLDELERDRPDMHRIIHETRIRDLPADVPIASVSPAMLEGMMARAYALASGPRPTFPRQLQVLRRGVEAARELVGRANRTAITPEMIEAATRTVGYMLEALDQRADAVAAYLKYPPQYQASHPKSALWCLDGAAMIVAEMRKTKTSDPQVSELSRQVASELSDLIAKSSDLNVREGATRRLQRFQAEMK